MKINRHLQGDRSDAVRVVPDKVLQRGSFPFDEHASTELHGEQEGEKKKRSCSFPFLMDFIFNTCPLNCNMLLLFSYLSHPFHFDMQGVRHVTI